MKTLIINSSNLVPSAFNNEYKYVFPQGSVAFKDDAVAVASISMYFSFFNIAGPSSTAQYNNNKFSYRWIDGLVYDVVLEDGYYEYTTINEFLQFTMIGNGHYVITDTGSFVYYLELLSNTTFYAVQLVCSPVPTSLPVGWTAGPGLVLPGVPTTPQFIIDASNNFKTVVGFLPGTYPPVPQNQTYTILSQETPQISPVQSIIMQANLLNNKYALPSSLLYSFAPSGVPFGSLINITPPSLLMNEIQTGSYNDFTIAFYDQNLNKLYIKDPNIVVLLMITKQIPQLYQ